jgi:hypothetical protein
VGLGVGLGVEGAKSLPDLGRDLGRGRKIALPDLGRGRKVGLPDLERGKQV